MRTTVIPALELRESPIREVPEMGAELWVITFHGAPIMQRWNGSSEMMKCLRHGIYFRSQEGADQIRHHILDTLEQAVRL